MVVDTISVTEAAKMIGKNPQYIRVGLQQGRFNFGTAVKTSGRWNYIIIRSKFYRFCDIKVKRKEEE